MNFKIILGGVIIVFLVSLGIWQWQRTEPPSVSQTQTTPVTNNPTTSDTKTNSLGSQIYAQTSDPVGSQLPQTNPLAQTSANPFSGYTNPFDTK